MRSVILHISGPPKSGKTTLARILASRSPSQRPHYVRFFMFSGKAAPVVRLSSDLREMGSIMCRHVRSKYVFEEVSDVLKSLCGDHRSRTVFVETDSHPSFRHAFPYHVNVFMMRPPVSLDHVFRTEAETADAIGKAMDDTSEFAAEYFGVDRDSLDSAILPSVESSEQTTTAEATQTVDDFLNSAVGIEIASRIKLQPEYQSIIDSDVILLNDALEHDCPVVAPCARKIGFLLEVLCRRLGRPYWFAVCNPLEQQDPLTQRSLTRIESLLQATRNSAL